MSAQIPHAAIRRDAGIAALLARMILGGMFLHMGIVKILAPVDFLKLAHQYQMTDSHWLLNSIAATLPWFEAFCGVLLILGIAVRGAALIALVMLVSFAVMVARRALEIQAASALAFCSIRFDCGCGTGEVFVCHKLVQNCLLAVLALVLLWWPGHWRRPRQTLPI